MLAGQAVGAGRDVDPRRQAIAPLDPAGKRPDGVAFGRLDPEGDVPAAPDQFPSHEPVVPGVFRIRAEGGLRRTAGDVRDAVRDPLAARGGRADPQSGQRIRADAPGQLLAAVVVADARARQRPVGHRDGRRERGARPAGFDAGVPAEGRDERQSRFGRRRADRERRAPAPPAHAQQIVGARWHGVGPQRGQVLIRERITDEDLFGLIPASSELAEDRRDTAGLDVERHPAPRTNSDVGGVGVRRLEIVRPHLGKKRGAGRRLPLGGHRGAERPQRVAPVVGVVEERLLVVGADGGGDLAADADASVEQLDGLGRQLRAGRRRQQHEDQRGRKDLAHGQWGFITIGS